MKSLKSMSLLVLLVTCMPSQEVAGQEVGGPPAQLTGTSTQDPAVKNMTLVEVEPGVRDEVVDWGGTGAPVVLLAGAGNTAHVFDSFAPRLTEHFHVFGITRRGFGASSAPTQGYGADRLADDDLAILEFLHLVKPVLVGHSKAGQELSSIATRHADRVSGLIYLEATYPYAYQGPGTDLKPAFDALQQRSFSLVKPPTGSDMANLASYQAWFLGAIGVLIPEADLRETLRIGLDGRVNGSQAAPDTFKAYMAGEQKYRGTKAVPILAICSESHSYGAGFGKASPDQAAKFLGEERILLDQEVTAFAMGNPGAHIVRIPDSNHYIFLSNGEQVAAEINTFIGSLH